jgi:hypothetical protein
VNLLARLFGVCLIAWPLAGQSAATAGDGGRDDSAAHWAFLAPRRPQVAATPHGTSSDNAIDAFVRAEQRKHGVVPTDPAEKHVLLRRAYLDLVGLPPTRDELHAFLSDDSPDAYERIVDRLLASPRYGERWARHWMDVWRYSDWYGRRAVPDVWNSAPQVWRWRDWIVASLNADRGYDRMVAEMLAADEIAPTDDDAAVATGYLIRNWYALNPNQWMRDNVEHTAKAFLGLTFNCAHCHDHKYDPISQEDYFRFRAFFEPIYIRQDRVSGESDPGPFQDYNYSVLRKVVNLGAVRIFDQKLDAKTYMYRMGDERSRVEGRPPVEPGVPGFLGAESLRIAPVTLPATAYYPGLRPFAQQAQIAESETALREAETELAKSRSELAAIEGQVQACRGDRAVESKLDTAESNVRAADAQRSAALAHLDAARARIAADIARFGPAVSDSAGELSERASRIERKANLCAAHAQQAKAAAAMTAARQMPDSDPKAKEAVTKAQQQVDQAAKAAAAAHQALIAPGESYTPLTRVYPATSTGRRRALAEWIASRQNPLTARVAVNHIWMRHFGQPLVASVFDFGRNGKAPTHPELLDWLAVELMDSGWSMKHVHRLIVTSSTYRQASEQAAGSWQLASEQAVGNRQLAVVGKREDANSLLPTPNSLLPSLLCRFPTRRLEAEVIRDAVLHAAGQLDGQIGGAPLDNNLEPTARRRSLYFSVFPEDGGHMRFLTLFDAPDPGDCYRRSQSIVPQQALGMTNSQILLSNSRLGAAALTRELAPPASQLLDDATFVTAAFEQVLTRRPTADELAACQDFLNRQRELYRGANPTQLSATATETAAPAADPQARARESLVRVLFNHDDFVTMR